MKKGESVKISTSGPTRRVIRSMLRGKHGLSWSKSPIQIELPKISLSSDEPNPKYQPSLNEEVNFFIIEAQIPPHNVNPTK